MTELGTAKLRYCVITHSAIQVPQDGGGTSGSGKVVIHEPKSSVNIEEPSGCHSRSKRRSMRGQVGENLRGSVFL